MAKDNNIQDFLTDVADAIREKKGTTDLINPQDFSSEITSIQSGGRDWGEIGYDAEPTFIEEGFAYAKEIKNNWDETATSSMYEFSNDSNLIFLPTLNYDNCTNIAAMCQYCTNLQYVDLIHAPIAIRVDSLFRNCDSLKYAPIYAPNAQLANNLFSGTRITSFEAEWTDKVTTFSSAFINCKNLIKIKINTQNAENLGNLVQGCANLESIEFVGGTDNIKDLSYAFSSCGAKIIPPIASKVCTNFLAIFYSNNVVERVELLNFSSITNHDFFGGGAKLRFLQIEDLGKSSLATYDFSGATNWGVATTDIPDARQSLIDSLITYSYDRASNGMPTATIKLSANTKALLTEEEIAQITNKGFTIA